MHFSCIIKPNFSWLNLWVYSYGKLTSRYQMQLQPFVKNIPAKYIRFNAFRKDLVKSLLQNNSLEITRRYR